MSNTPIIVSPEKYRAALNVVGTDVTVLAAKQHTEGLEFTYQSGGERMGPPPHSHDWDEAFFVTNGTIEFFCDGQTTTCPTGTLVFIPGGTTHGFQYGPGGGEMLEIAGAGSEAAQVFTALDAEVPPGPPDVAKIVEVMKSNGVTVNL